MYQIDAQSGRKDRNNFNVPPEYFKKNTSILDNKYNDTVLKVIGKEYFKNYFLVTAGAFLSLAVSIVLIVSVLLGLVSSGCPSE